MIRQKTKLASWRMTYITCGLVFSWLYCSQPLQLSVANAAENEIISSNFLPLTNSLWSLQIRLLFFKATYTYPLCSYQKMGKFINVLRGFPYYSAYSATTKLLPNLKSLTAIFCLREFTQILRAGSYYYILPFQFLGPERLRIHNREIIYT